MSNKILRKELELTLVKTIEEALTKVNPAATKKIKKATHEAAKSVAKKFFKTIKTEAKIKAPTKTIAKKAAVISKNVMKAPVKKVVQK